MGVSVYVGIYVDTLINDESHMNHINNTTLYRGLSWFQER